MTDPVPPLDLGLGVTLEWTAWAPDRELNPQYAHIPDLDPIGALIMHPSEHTETGRCEGGIMFDLPHVAEVFPGKPLWTVESLDPLTLSPSILCTADGHDFHGYIREGRWVPA